ncbi:protein of unknown function (plasmid) [Cupriavidus taiwanensis]|uniref:Uncharacterized protein n=1 Tax=Cupriavidus taiwanensis TaxID=164546 RepID=A0A375FM37_9BURK|nr:protein of unknown function [Cupriavidus taiwanensis]SOZ72394.1 protein of unknown function [Cupriavidus taiwanensis]SOZ74742.1 protein of unknown function [Cupriavidus taiwanensis]SPA03597.1 protein of unknown function [Cupriavidus taiwanensis]SPA11497.1 protein of unknown function [Cupriavidus taiwanensis]
MGRTGLFMPVKWLMTQEDRLGFSASQQPDDPQVRCTPLLRPNLLHHQWPSCAFIVSRT